MTVTITIPKKEEIFARSIPVNVASEGETWSRTQLGDYALKSGVYVHSFNKKILYVGMTSGETGDTYGIFGERLRREFQSKASQNSDLYNLLASQNGPIDVCMFDRSEIDALITNDESKFSPKAHTCIFEQALIAAFTPPGNKL
ncbi:hypothetical protein H0R92_07080 [Treponema sp. OMZ 840]|uniref:hypothetical protein n=1 Tax=Treponema sp. OMZ 840 TaxID=244313 RepID=UPI003D8FEAED